MVEGSEGGADILHHGLGDAGQEACVDGSDHRVDLPTDTRTCRTYAVNTYNWERWMGAKPEMHTKASTCTEEVVAWDGCTVVRPQATVG